MTMIVVCDSISLHFSHRSHRRLRRTALAAQFLLPISEVRRKNCSSKKNFWELNDEELIRDCEMGTFKSSRPGGQHRNKRELAFRLKHIPTGIVAQAVENRSQHKNRASALAGLRTLLALEVRKNGMQALPDLIFAVEGSVSEAAKLLGLSTIALSRLILPDDSL